MSLLQLTKVIDAVNELALKVQKLEVQVQSILNDKHNEKVTIVDPMLQDYDPLRGLDLVVCLTRAYRTLGSASSKLSSSASVLERRSIFRCAL